MSTTSNLKAKAVSVVGLGYIGLPTALLLANTGVKVVGIDVDQRKLSQLANGMLPFEEPGLDELWAQVQKAGTFSVQDTVETSDYYIIAVPTPHQKKSSDLQYVFQALESISNVYQSGQIIILESTVGPSDIDTQLIPKLKKWKHFPKLAHCPERAIPGRTLLEMINNDRVVGADSEETALEVSALYQKFVSAQVFTTTLKTAALAKVMENTYRAVNIALANELAVVADAEDFDIWEAIKLANKHPRVAIHAPGPGVGGHCIPVDPWFLVSDETKIITTSLKRNQSMANYIVTEVKKYCQFHNITKPTVALLGYAYKPNVDDARETPAEQIARQLEVDNVVLTTDPFVKNSRRKMVTLNTALEKADLAILITNHTEYNNINFSTYPNIAFVYDTRNALASNTSISTLYTLGRQSIS